MLGGNYRIKRKFCDAKGPKQKCSCPCGCTSRARVKGRCETCYRNRSRIKHGAEQSIVVGTGIGGQLNPPYVCCDREFRSAGGVGNHIRGSPGCASNWEQYKKQHGRIKP